ncbi:LytTR family DNA-binding domain-containing protein [Phenylobacterium sp.]|uniref:LytTR family DNA-binding domain-containing protein n=1 Tax=Phenylobacterium sp. TaxID=1871053 RepID=UPI0028999921|nr:LytTR family DNA-binding domain-containing protein [Phenylobacterium sp.]
MRSAKAKWFDYGPMGGLAGWRRGFAIAAVAAVFLAVSGAFGMGRLSLMERLAYWVGLLSAGTVWGGLMSRFAFPGGDANARPWLRTLLYALVIAGPITLLVWAVNSRLLHAPIPARALASLFVSVALVTLVMTAVNVLAARARAEALAAPAAPPPRFLERLPLKLRGAEVWAVEAEDHYLRLHTSKGQDLILLRLADAVAELEGIEGAQVHRSWWVAREAIADARRGDGRATLTLKDGSQVPVSRTYARLLRDRGWI